MPAGLVDRPLTISMAELVQMPTITMPVTLNCAGNRRKEQNLVPPGPDTSCQGPVRKAVS